METPAPVEDSRDSGNLGIWLVVAALLVAGLLLWIVLSGDGDDPASDLNGGAEIVSVDSLRDVAAEQTTPLYWAGEQEGTELELSQPDGKSAYVRYLPEGTEAGDPRPDFLTVGTYANAKAVAALRRLGNEPGGVIGEAPGGATVYYNRNQPESVYLAYPGAGVEIEVYDPDFKQALQLVNSGQIVDAG